MPRCVAQPYRSVANLFHTFQVKQDGLGSCLLNPVEYGCHATPAVNARAYHQTDFVEQAGCQEGAVDMSAAYNGQASDTETLCGHFHGPGQIDVFFAGGNP